MKDSEFIELLNLYLDHEISAADAARLEAEVQDNADRRKIYLQYCRMQKACTMLAGDFQAKAAAAPDVAVIELRTARSRRPFGRYIAVGATLAAAASVTILFVGRGRQDAVHGDRQPSLALSLPAEVSPDPMAAGPVRPARTLAHTVSMPVPVAEAPAASLKPDHLLLERTARSEALLRAAAEQAAAQFAWMERVQLAPLQPQGRAEPLRFEARPASLRTESRTYGNRQQPLDPQIEMTAFRFQR